MGIEMYNKKATIEVKKKGQDMSFMDKLCIFDPYVDLSVLEFILRELHKKEEPKLEVIVPKKKQGTFIMESNMKLQKILKREQAEGLDEPVIVNLDRKVRENIDSVLLDVYQFSKHHIANKELTSKAKGAMMSRVSQRPFGIPVFSNQSIYKNVGITNEFKEHKKDIQNVFMYLQLHPCYLEKVLTQNFINYEQKCRLISSLFTSTGESETNRLNYLLISCFEKVFTHDLNRVLKNFRADVSSCFFFDKNNDYEMISVHIFNVIFDSNQTNLDTICCIACHIINKILTTYSQT